MWVWILVQERVQAFSLDGQLARVAAGAAAAAAAAGGARLVRPQHLEITRHVQVLHGKPAAFASRSLRKGHWTGLDQRVHRAVGKVGAGGEAQGRQVVALVGQGNYTLICYKIAAT